LGDSAENTTPGRANARRAALAAGALALACFAVAGYKLSTYWKTSNATLLPPSSCDPSTVPECALTLPQGEKISLSILPHPIRPLENLTLAVKISGFRASQVAVDFDGVDMSMGYNRAVLEGNGENFSGRAILPVCVTGTMAWKATVLVTTEKGLLAAPFHFEVAGR